MSDRPVTKGGEDPQSALIELARQGAAIALKERRARMALFYRGALSGLIGAVIVMLPVSVALQTSAVANASRQARANCAATANTRPQGNARAFVEREILTIAVDAFNQFPPAFRHREDLAVTRAAQLEARLAPDQGLARVASFAGLAGLVRDLPLLSCRHVLR